MLYPELDSAPGRVCCLLLRAAASAAAEARGTDSFTLRFGNAPSLPYLGHVHGARLFPRRCAPFVALPATRMPPPPGSYRTTGAGALAGALAAAAPAGSMPSPPSSRVTDAGAPATALAAATPAGSMAVPPVAHVTDAGTPATSLAADASAGSMAEPQNALSAAADATPAALLALTKLPHSAPPTHGLCSATELAPLIPASFLGIDLSGALDAAAKYGLLGLVELLLACSPQKPASVDLDSALNNAAQEVGYLLRRWTL
ncbi:hypothetical protein DUNSADRAFT_370 [Dunaliella salina]|uniref:Encoded protein n=1 Tax=Dunaliella salina TaxID=3046 RepID=A0ABQ7GYB1_DUNSA|nr:hypothetical protein DUNSADRAFT_370 [Dunaliella salina]|eukprot:KAF5839591.1 hypothetical protein DUNSADRAFT_370 [Dunaliella salina]